MPLNQPETKTYALGDWELQSGAVLPNAQLAYATLGSPSNPVIIYPTWYSGTISTNLWLLGPGKTLDPAKYCIVIPALFGNGESTSPSNSPHIPRPYPKVTFYDNVRAQHQLMTQALGITHARAVVGWSMGAAQTFQWATQYPSFMDVAVPFCGSARTSLHNQVFLEGVKAALLSAKGCVSAGVCRGEAIATTADAYKPWNSHERDIGLRALGRVYAGWGFSQAFYRQRLYETTLGFKDLEHFVVEFWEAWALSKDPENMLAMLETWQAGDVSRQAPYNGNFEAALGAIQAKMLVLPSQTDLYFPSEDSAYEVQCMSQQGALEVFPSVWGHWAGGPGDSKEDAQWLDERLRRALA